METERESGWQRFWERGRWWRALVAVVGYLVLYEAAGLGVGTVFRDQIDTKNIFSSAGSVFFTLGAGLLVGAVILLVFLASVRWIRPVFSKQPIRGRWWMWIFVVLAVIPIFLRLAGIDYGSYGASVVITTLLVGLIIGFTEELLYRGIVVRILREAGHGEGSVAVISSALFGLSHSLNAAGGQPILTVALTVVFAFGFGMVMYMVMRATGNIIWPMIVHGLTDPTTFLSSGGVDTSTGAAHSALLDAAGPFNMIFVALGVIAIIVVRGRVTQVDPRRVNEA